ncbi:MAG: farnesyl diphosphate synthase [Pseudomonadota bacterium]|nr:farnesyl diphosphate synthase [Pseudomonadota bacterium]MEE2820212.1 farnesyl diphosphate synthase [Pseudomonadota bacterium]
MDQDWLEQIRIRIDQALDNALGTHLGDSKLLDAARYSVLRGGKRLRPALVYAAADAAGASPDEADAAAIAVELLHAYSLIHDDLPAMDDDALRRGQPTTHVAFDEATAILAGDALQALAFSILGEADIRTDRIRVKQLNLLGEAVGFRGMALGQAIDLESEGQALSLDALKTMHAKKTGALITASVLMGAACGNPSDDDWNALTQAGQAIGLAFQIQDDILDETAPTEMLGKTQGRDQILGKSTFPSLLGLEASEQEAYALVEIAQRALARVAGDTTMLRQLARLSVERTN